MPRKSLRPPSHDVVLSTTCASTRWRLSLEHSKHEHDAGRGYRETMYSFFEHLRHIHVKRAPVCTFFFPPKR